MELKYFCCQYVLQSVLHLFRQSENQREVIRDEPRQLNRAMLEDRCILVHTPAGGLTRCSQQPSGPSHTACLLTKISLNSESSYFFVNDT